MDFTGLSQRALLHGTPGVFLAAAAVSPKDYGAGSNRVLVRVNIVYGAARDAVTRVGGTGHTVTGTRWRSITPGAVNNGGSGTVLADNLQF